MNRFNFRHYNKLAKAFTYYGAGELQVDLNREFKSGLIFPMADDSSMYMGTYSELQQCTGLKDDNGRLIYEGDILKYAEFDWNDESFKDIETNQAVVIWGGEYDYPAFDLKGTDFDGTNGLSYLFGAGWHFEVIGNIYENADLIEGGANAEQVQV